MTNNDPEIKEKQVPVCNNHNTIDKRLIIVSTVVVSVIGVFLLYSKPTKLPLYSKNPNITHSTMYLKYDNLPENPWPTRIYTTYGTNWYTIHLYI